MRGTPPFGRWSTTPALRQNSPSGAASASHNAPRWSSVIPWRKTLREWMWMGRNCGHRRSSSVTNKRSDGLWARPTQWPCTSAPPSHAGKRRQRAAPPGRDAHEASENGCPSSSGGAPVPWSSTCSLGCGSESKRVGDKRAIHRVCVCVIQDSLRPTCIPKRLTARPPAQPVDEIMIHTHTHAWPLMSHAHVPSTSPGLQSALAAASVCAGASPHVQACVCSTGMLARTTHTRAPSARHELMRMRAADVL